MHVNGFGLFLFILYPGAFVDLSPDHIHTVSPLRQLRIYCAGVWHNFIIVIFGALLLGMLPVCVLPLYKVNQGVMVTNVVQVSTRCLRLVTTKYGGRSNTSENIVKHLYYSLLA